MKVKRMVCFGFIGYVCAGFLSAQTEDRIPITKQRLSDRVLVLSETLMNNNVVAIASEKGIVVVDTSGLPSTAAEMRRIIEKEFGRSDFAYVINTHSHWDHTFGNQVFPEAVVIGHDEVIPGMARDKDIIPRRIADLEERRQKEASRLKSLPLDSEEARSLRASLVTMERQIHDFKDVFVSTTPRITFNDQLALDLGDVTVKLDYFGRAHSTSDTFVRVPEEGILMTGDLFLDQRWVPLFAGQPVLDIDRWLEVLGRALDGEDAPAKVIPAHMDIWETRKLVLWRDYIRYLWEGLKGAKEKGLTLEQAKEKFPLPEPCAYLRDRGHTEERIRDFHENNIEAFWSQLFIPAADIIEEILADKGIEGIEEAKSKFQELRKQPDIYLISEGRFNAQGYRFLQTGRLSLAMTVFRMNVEAFPRSANVYDSLAEAYFYLGDKHNSILYYRKSLELDPQNENARSRLERMDELFEEAHPSTPEDALLTAGEQTGLKGPYLGQKPPGMTAEVFAPGLVSLEGRYEFALSFSPEGDELLFTGTIPKAPSLVFHSRIAHGRWTKPIVVSLSGGAKKEEMEAFFSGDGRSVFFAPYDEGLDVRIWKVDRTEGGWIDPAPLEGQIADESAFYPTCSERGTLYYSNIARRKIFKATLENGIVKESGEAGLEFGGHGFIAPDESFILLDATREDGRGKQDIYVAFRNADGSWSKPVSLGPEVNTEFSETCPSLSPDGKYLFFSRYDEPGELSNFYWIDGRVIGEARRNFSFKAKDWSTGLLKGNGGMGPAKILKNGGRT